VRKLRLIAQEQLELNLNYQSKINRHAPSLGKKSWLQENENDNLSEMIKKKKNQRN